MTLTITDERAADQAVIATLVRELNKRGTMDNLFKLADGRVIRTDSFEVVSPEELNSILAKLKADLAIVNGFIFAEQTPAVEPAAPETQPVLAEQAATAPIAEQAPAAEPVAAPAPEQQAVEPVIQLQ